jgi:hypothetical protein
MLLKKVGHYNIVKNKKNILKTLYKYKKSFYINKNEKFIKIKKPASIKKGGKNNCGLRYDGKTTRDLDEFMTHWMRGPANVAYSEGQKGYYIKREYIKPINNTDLSCTDKENHIHIFECDIWQDRETDDYNIDIGYSQKNRGVPIKVDFDPMNPAARPNVLVNVKGNQRNYRFFGRSRDRNKLFIMASNFFKRVFDETEYHNKEFMRGFRDVGRHRSASPRRSPPRRSPPRRTPPRRSPPRRSPPRYRSRSPIRRSPPRYIDRYRGRSRSRSPRRR